MYWVYYNWCRPTHIHIILYWGIPQSHSGLLEMRRKFMPHFETLSLAVCHHHFCVCFTAVLSLIALFDNTQQNFTHFLVDLSTTIDYLHVFILGWNVVNVRQQCLNHRIAWLKYHSVETQDYSFSLSLFKLEVFLNNCYFRQIFLNLLERFRWLAFKF
jgi:hypothetical protein